MGMNMQQMMRQAQKMQKELAKAQEEVAAMTFEGTAAGGTVSAVARGDMTIESRSRSLPRRSPPRTTRCCRTWCASPSTRRCAASTR